MHVLSSWATTIFISIFICTICEFFIFDSKFYQLVKGILGVFLLINLLIPIKNIKIPKVKLYTQGDNSTNLDRKFENRFEIVAKEKIERKISDFLHFKGIKEKKINIHINKNNISCDISFEKGVENQKSIVKDLKKQFGINFYLIN